MDFKKIFIYLVFVTLCFSCESDDVCDGSIPTTPSLVIEVYDATNTSIVQSTSNLKITEVGNPNALVFDNNATLLNTTKFKIPLKSNTNTVSYEFASNANLINNVINPALNIDVITFNYTTKDVYISRACGYKTIYEIGDFNYTNNVVDFTGENSKWIKNVQFINKTIDNETNVHLKIYF